MYVDSIRYKELTIPLRKMNIDRELILKGGAQISPERKVAYYRFIVRVCRAGIEIME